MVAVLVVEEAPPLHGTDWTLEGVARVLGKRPREAFLVSFFAKKEKKANQRGACLGQCNAECHGRLFSALGLRFNVFFTCSSALCGLDDRSMGAVSNRLGLCQSGAGSL